MDPFDFALVELSIEDAAYPASHFAAYIRTPLTFDIANMTPESTLPLQGVAWSEGATSDYADVPILAFPFNEIAPIDTVPSTTKYASLLIDLRSMPTNVPIKIDLYGYVDVYSITGGDGSEAPYVGAITASDYYGTLTRHYEDVVPATPEGLAAAVQYLKIPADLDSFGQGRLVNTFPELAGYPHAYEGVADYNSFAVSFQWNTALTPDAWDSSGTATPNDDPNAFFIYTPNNTEITSFWTGTSFEKTIVFVGDGSNCSGEVTGSGPDLTGLAEIPTPPPYGGTSQALIIGADPIRYFVPTRRYDLPRTGTIKAVAISGDNPWTAEVDWPSTVAGESFTWENPLTYPDKVPAMVTIGTATVPAQTLPDDTSPYNHFGMPLIGTITIFRMSSDGAITFAEEDAPPIDGGETGDGPDGDGTAPGRTANPQLRVWTFTLDGHDFYVLRLGDSATFVYDDYAEQWTDWTDFDSTTWRAHCGFNWIGAQGLADTYGSSVVAGDDAYGLLWFLDPNQPFDDAPSEGAAPIYFSRVTVGQVPMVGREVLPCYAVWLTTDMGDPAYLGAGVTLYTSDDAGVTWDNQGFVKVTPGENSPELSWYSLGQIAAPGRLFKIFDNGAVTRIDALEMNDPDDK